MNNPPIRLTNDQFHALNRVIAVARVAVEATNWMHHFKTIERAQQVLAVCEVDGFKFDLAEMSKALSPV